MSDGVKYEKSDAAGIIDISQSLTKQLTVTVNVDQDVHVITRDKVRIALMESLPNYRSPGSLLAPLSVVLAFLAALVTADFKSVWGITGPTWHAVFLIGAIASGAWVVWEVVRWRSRLDVNGVVAAVLKDAPKV